MVFALLQYYNIIFLPKLYYITLFLCNFELNHINNSIMRYIAIKTLLVVSIFAFTLSCSEQPKSGSKIITTTITPLKFIVESITGEDYAVNIVVPQGASPETYEMTAKQVIDIANSEFVFSLNLLDFEKGISERLQDNSSNMYVDLSRGIELLSGKCTLHDHVDDEDAAHGVDPHIWTSISNLKTISKSVHDAIISKHPDSLRYTNNYKVLLDSLNRADSLIRSKLSKSDIKHFLIYHPSLGYYAKEYGLTQITLENEGKEPNVKEMKEVIDMAKELNLTNILYQKEFRKDVVVSATQDIGGECCEINILGENIINDLIQVTDIIINE